MSRRLGILACIVLISPLAAFGQGFSVGNFGIAAQSSEGKVFSRILVNPAKLGEWLQELGSSSVAFEIEGRDIADSEVRWESISRDFPEFQLTTSDPALKGLQVQLRAFAPLGVGAQKSSLGFLPVIFLRITLRNPTSRQIAAATHFSLRPPQAVGVHEQTLKAAKGEVVLATLGHAFIATRAAASVIQTDGAVQLSAARILAAGDVQTLDFYVGAFEPNGAYTREHPDLESLIGSVVQRQAALEQDHAQFVKMLPRTGDPELDRALRWYVSAAILLTRGTRNEVLTLGYRELNQRDSFWTSWIHLFFWPDLERRMIRESMAAQKPNGQIPTTILPLIENEAIDITEYFVLRVLRYYEWHRDEAFLAQAWPSVQKAIAFLKRCDADQVGLPRQSTYWADWKDVEGVQGREYAPHFTLLWLAVLDGAAKAAEQLGKADEARALEADYKKAFAAVHRDLWNGHYYVDRWSGGRTSGVVLQDQVIGILFGVVPPRNAASIFEALRTNETPWGVRETFPYMKEPFEQPNGGAGNYHNGGIWPWLNFVDATARYIHGRAADAERIIRNLARADLQHDWTPNEFLNGDDGSNHGFPIQGWNGSIFAAIYRGAFGLERSSATQMKIQPRIAERNFETWLVLPGGTARIKRVAGKLCAPEVPVTLRYRLVSGDRGGSSTRVLQRACTVAPKRTPAVNVINRP